MMNKPNNNELQIYLLDMMHWFHNFCVTNNLRYYALGGTMLGAVRHSGFIPWDDDLDIGMPRKDYEELYSLMKCHLCDRYILETPYSSEIDFNYCFSKLYDTETTLVENLKYKIRRGIYIDIFPLDGMGHTKEDSKRNFRKIDRKFKILLAHTTGLRKGRNRLKNLAVIISQTVLNPFINDKKAILQLNNELASRDYDDYEYVGNPFGAWRFKEIMRKDIMGTPTLYRFENIEIFGVEKPDEYLTHLYGNWKQLPPIEKQTSHHDYVELDLKHSYLQ